MIIYNPNGEHFRKERLTEAEKILNEIPAKHCFISGSFLFKEKYGDVDVFVISRSKKEFKTSNNKVKISVIDFNNLYSLFYHSVSKSCISKSILPVRPLKVTIADFWSVVNESVPVLMNKKKGFEKDVRSLILYTEYFKTGKVLDTFELNILLLKYNTKSKIIAYISNEIPFAIQTKIKKSYLKRFFYTQAGFYRGVDYPAQKYLNKLVHTITRGLYG